MGEERTYGSVRRGEWSGHNKVRHDVCVGKEGEGCVWVRRE